MAQDSILRLNNLYKALTKEINKETLEFDSFKQKVTLVARDLIYSLTEMMKSLAINNNFDRNIIMLKNLITSIDSLNAESLIASMTNIIEKLEDSKSEIEKSINHNIISYDIKCFLHYDRKKEYYDNDVLSILGKKIKCNTERKINILHIKPRDTYLIDNFKKNIDQKYNIDYYAAFVREDKGEIVRPSYVKLALGEEKGSVISNKVFDIVINDPDITLEKELESLPIRQERDDIRNSIKFVRPGGYLIIILPRYRLYNDIIVSISREFDHIEIRKEIGITNFSYLYIVAKKKLNDEEKDLNRDVYNKLRLCYDEDKIEQVSLDLVHYNFNELLLPNEELDVNLFKGSLFDQEELKIIAKQGICYQNFLRTQIPKNKKRKSILPFNASQVGLVITGGENNGIVTETINDKEYAHVIKGQVVKVTDQKIERTEGKITKTTVTSNRVAINLFLADGTYKSLL